MGVRLGGVCCTSGWDDRLAEENWARKSRGESSESLRVEVKDALCERSRVRGAASGAGEFGDRSYALDGVGRNDERRRADERGSIGIRLVVGVAVEFDCTGEGECRAEGSDWRLLATLATLDLSLSTRAVASEGRCCFGAVSAAMFRNRSSFSPSVPGVTGAGAGAGAPRPLCAAW